ncbi:MAG: L,D-transpeptidase family protein [Propionibacteriaceae bacterium]
MTARLIRILLALLLTTAVASVTLMTSAAEAASKTVKVKVITTYTAPAKGERSASVKALQSRLWREGVLKKTYLTSYFGDNTAQAVKAFQRKNHLRVTGKVDASTWKTLVAKSGSMTTTTSSVVTKLPKKCRVTGRVLCADKTSRNLYYLVDGNLVKTLDARFGCSYDSRATRQGTFTILRKSKHWVSTIYHSAMPYSMFFSGGQAVHYSSDFAARGYRGCSHGCINIRDKSGLAYVYAKMKVGDRVVVYRA